MQPRTLAALLILGTLQACGGGSKSPAPSPSPVPTPTELWSASGRITTYGSGASVVGARVSVDGAPAVQTDSNGSYKVSGTAVPSQNPFKITVQADGFLTRDFYVEYKSGARTGLDVNVIRDAAPFSFSFYKQLVRDDYDKTNGELELNWRLIEVPKFYVRTVDQHGRKVEPEVINTVLPAIRRGVREWTNGSFTVSTIETGTQTRERTEGWIMVNITRDYKSEFCGRSYVGSTQGLIELVDDRCSCGSNKISGAIVVHEVGHALGFFHVSDRHSIMYPYLPGQCPPGTLSANEKYHSALAYSRTRGNADPDSDHPSAYMIRAGAAGPDILITN